MLLTSRVAARRTIVEGVEIVILVSAIVRGFTVNPRQNSRQDGKLFSVIVANYAYLPANPCPFSKK